MTFDRDNTVRNPNDPWHREWGTGSVITSLVVIVIVAGILAYGATKATEIPIRSTTISQAIAGG